MRRMLGLLALLSPLSAAATVTLTVNVSNVSPAPIPGAYIRVDLMNCAGPSIINTSTPVPLSQKFYLPSGSMQVTMNLPDNVSQIACSGNQLSYYTLTLVSGTTQTTLKSVELPAGTFNLANLANLTQPPFNPGVIQGPTGPAGEQGPAGSNVPLTDANLVANTTAIIGSPVASQTITQPADSYFSFNFPVVYGAVPAIRFGATAGTSRAIVSNPAPGQFSFDSSTVGDGLGTVKAQTFNGVLLSSAGTANLFLNNSGGYSDPLANVAYQLAANSSTTLPARKTIRFLAGLSVVDNSVGGTTDVSLTNPVTPPTPTTTHPTYTFGQVQQNTTTQTRFVVVTVNSTIGCTATSFVDNTTSPTTFYSRATSAQTGSSTVNSALPFMVLAGQYYQVTTDHCVITGISETNL